MALVQRRLPQNVEGDFFVDDTCIDCDACRQIAPGTFRDHGDQSSVGRQPSTPEEVDRALMALIACPTASIGTVSHRTAREAVRAFPDRVVDNVYFCGFTAEASFGAWSYLIVRASEDGGNVLVDSPRFAGPLVKRIEAMGGVTTMFLTHRDDIADHARFAAHFRCPRVMHRDDGAARLGIEQVIEGEAPVALGADLIGIPTPGHTRGHQVLLYRPPGPDGVDGALFTGDHLAWSPTRNTLVAFRDACWYSWPEQTRSMARLLGYRFEWVLPGHGRIHHAPAAEMRQHLIGCVEWMKQVSKAGIG
jgi:glyoxylase-like metal-dependent hydrolase (beta-lactamase superfamily II)/ferredoxin